MLLFERGKQISIVVSQAWITALTPEAPHPTEEQVATFLGSLEFVRLANSYFGWQRHVDQMRVLDARADNFILDDAGIVVPIVVLLQSTRR